MQMIELNYTVKATKFYTYRTAHARNVFLKVDRYSESSSAFETNLARQCGVAADNHTTYRIENSDGMVMYITCSDRYFYIGLSVEVRNW